MRTHFADSLDDLSCGLASMCGLTVTAMSEATAALLDADLRTAERVLDANTDLDRAASDWEHKAFSLLALQAPVAALSR
jgi:phosphate transport system protein